jgi:putative ABC transport system substrate-binding protein
MRRREFIVGLGSTAAWPVATQAQQPALPVIGYIGPSPDLKSRNNAAFFRGLNEAGYADGRNVTIAYRWVEGHNDRLPGFVSELVSRRVAVIAVVDSTAAVLAAKAATQTIPIVFRIGGERPSRKPQPAGRQHNGHNHPRCATGSKATGAAA